MRFCSIQSTQLNRYATNLCAYIPLDAVYPSDLATFFGGVIVNLRDSKPRHGRIKNLHDYCTEGRKHTYQDRPASAQ